MIKTLRRQSWLLLNSTFLTLGFLVVAVSGSAYWWMAARMLPPSAVGAQSALISALGVIAVLGEGGFGTILIGEAQTRSDRTAGLATAAMLAGTGTVFMLTVPITVVLWNYGWLAPREAAVFVLAGVLSGLAMLVDRALIGLLRSNIQFTRNLIFALARPPLLAVALLLAKGGEIILYSWAGALIFSLGLVFSYSWRGRINLLAWPNFAALRVRIPAVIDHHLLNIAALAPPLMMPILVRGVLGTATAGAFYVGWMVMSISLIAPASLTTVLFAIGSKEPAALPERFRFSFGLSIAFALFCCLGFAMGGQFMLALFNPKYLVLAGSAVPWLGVGVLGGAVKNHYVLLARVRGRMLPASIWMAVGGSLEIVFAIEGGRFGGVVGLTKGWIVAVVVETLMFGQPVIEAVRDSLRKTVAPCG